MTTSKRRMDYGDLLHGLAAQGPTMLCANPDHMVERGHRLVYCAGALAAVYETLGGEVIYAGKPHAPVYELALETARKIAGEAVEKAYVLAIGDGVRTDIAGARGFGLDAIFVASGLHAPGEGRRSPRCGASRGAFSAKKPGCPSQPCGRSIGEA